MDISSELSQAARSVGALTFLSRLSGLARDAALGALFGASPLADAFFAAFRLPNFVRRTVAEGAPSMVIVPALLRRAGESGWDSARSAAGSAGAGLLLLLFGLAGLVLGLATPLAGLLAPGFATDATRHALTADFLRSFAPYLVAIGMVAWGTGVLHAHGRFGAPSAGPIAFNLTVIFAALSLRGSGGTGRGIAYAVVAGGFMHFALLLPSLARCGMRPSMLVPAAGQFSIAGAAAAGSALVGASVHQVNVLVASLLATRLAEGSVSHLWYADRLFEFPVGIIAVTVGTAALPSMTRAGKEAGVADLARTVEEAVSLALAFCIPAALGLYLLADDIVSALLVRGRFTSTDAIATAAVLRGLVPGLVGIAVVRVLVATCHASGRARLAAWAGLVAIALNAILATILTWPSGPAGVPPDSGPGDLSCLRLAAAAAWGSASGLALVASLATLANAAVLLVLVVRTGVRLRASRLWERLRPTMTASLAMSATVLAWCGWSGDWAFAGASLVRTGVGVALGAGVYGATALALGSGEVRSILGRGGGRRPPG